LNLEEYDKLKFVFIAIPIVNILLFYMFISSTTSSLISFTAWNFSILFIFVSAWILCEILNKDTGPKAMQEIAEVIREGSEGFFITQYGTIFKYAFLSAIGLFFLYAFREIPAQSALSEYFSPISMAFMTSVSFLFGSICSAISGYAGIWVSVRANLRVAAAAKKCYNDAIQICFRGGAFAAIINVALAIFGISSLYLIFSFYFYMQGAVNPPIEEIPVLLVGFGFGASFVAMFA
jgi:inorganic pyrophosphatase